MMTTERAEFENLFSPGFHDTKALELLKLVQGNEVLLSNGQTAIFQRRNKKTFIALINGEEYKIGNGCFVSVTEKQAKQIKEKQVGNLLKENDLFQVRSNVYKFVRFEGNEIVATGVINNQAIIRINIDAQLTILGNLR